MSSTQKPTCFVIAPIGPKDSDIRKHSDKVLKHIFKKALADKYDVKRGDEIDEPGMITSQVLREVQESHLVVAELTGHNPNVLYDLAVRHAIDKPVIHAIDPKLSKIPFDIAGFRTIEFDLTDPDSIESAVAQLQKQAEQAEQGKWGETPVKLANIMRRSTNDSQESILLKETVLGISRLQTSLAELTSMMASTSRPGQLKISSYGQVFEPTFVNTGSSEILAAQTLLKHANATQDTVTSPTPHTETTPEKKPGES